MWATLGRAVVRQGVRLAERQLRTVRRKDEEPGQGGGWLRWAVLIAAVAVFGVIGMMVMLVTAMFQQEQASACAPRGGIAGAAQNVQQNQRDRPDDGATGPGPRRRRTGRAATGQGFVPPDWSDKVLTPEQIADFAAEAGFGRDELAVAVAVALAESGGDVDAVNDQNSNGTTDYGLWQINSVHAQAGWFETSEAFEPLYNAQAARRIYMNAGSSWTPWVAFNSGAHEQHMPAAQAAADGTPVYSPQEVQAACGTGPAGTGTWAQALAGDFPATIDPYQAYDPQTTCDGTPKPGVTEFANLLTTAYPQSSFGGIVRECSAGGISEHKEGRAFDWMVNVSVPEQRAAAEEVLNTLLATDEHGNTHALFRRFGMMYMIWNRQIISSNRIDEGWRPYSCNGSPGDCHTNHIHFSFGWDGAHRRTTWWTPGPNRPAAGRQGQAMRPD